MIIQSYITEQGVQWDEIVKSFSNYDVYYLSGYAKACEVNGDGVGLLIYYNDGVNRGINVVMKRKIDDTYCDFITPYGYGGFLIEGDALKVYKEYEAFCVQQCVVSEFVRFHPVLENQDDESILLGNTISIHTESREKILHDMKSEGRNMFRKAEKNGVVIFSNEDLEKLPIFMELYAGTMDKDKATDYYYFSEEYYNILFSSLKRNIRMYYAEREKNIIAMAIVFFSNQKAHYHLSCSNKEGLQFAATNLLLLTVANDCVDMGYVDLHLGGGFGGKIDSLYKFKKAFNKEKDNEFYIGKKKYIQDIYDKLCAEKDMIDDGSFFPAYRK